MYRRRNTLITRFLNGNEIGQPVDTFKIFDVVSEEFRSKLRKNIDPSTNNDFVARTQQQATGHSIAITRMTHGRRFLNN